VVKKYVFLAVMLAMMLSLTACTGLFPGGKTYVMNGQSMEPTLHHGDKVTASPVNRELQRGDIVIYAPDKANIRLVHRVIGLSGETIEVKDGQVYINGTVLAEPYIAEKPQYSVKPVLIPEDHYFFLGDNRMESSDSHNFGPVPKDRIQGIVNR